MCPSDIYHAADRLLGLVLAADAALDRESTDRQQVTEDLMSQLIDLASDMRTGRCAWCPACAATVAPTNTN